MKAVVMAGGEGTRLRPLTVDRPKPMIPIVNRPVMEHIVWLLKSHGIDEIIATLQYLPDVIQDYFGDGLDFGVRMDYAVEAAPLGTAGSVMHAREYLDRTFLVISGDALTDMDLTDLIQFHRAKGSVATLALTRVANPLDFGVVITDGSGRIVRFLEKPTWSEVFSDTINTGIYVLEPEVFRFMKPERSYDWSKDIFPQMLRQGLPIYGYVSRNYWCDIGSVEQLMDASEACLAGRVRIQVPGEEIRRGLWLGRRVEIDPTAEITPPAVIGDGAIIRAGARVGAYTCLGPNSIVDELANIRRSVTMSHTFVGKGADVRAAWVCKGAALGPRSSIGQGAVIGDDAIVGEAAVIKPGVKLWPNKSVEARTHVNTSIVWGRRQTKGVFTAGNVSGLANIEVTPELVVRLGGAFGTTISRGDAVCVSRDSYPASVMLKRAMIAGLASAGVRVLNLEASPLAMIRHGIPTLGAEGGVFIMADPFNPGGVTLKFLDARGMDIDTIKERKIETLLVREDTRKVPADDVGSVSYPSKVVEYYRTAFLERIDSTVIRRRHFKVVLDYGHGAAGQLLPRILGDLGIQELALNTSQDYKWLSLTPDKVAEALGYLSRVVSGVGADLGVLFDASAERIYLVDNLGRPVDGQDALSLFVSLARRRKPDALVAVPLTASRAIDYIAGEKSPAVRVKTGARALIRAAFEARVDFGGDVYGGYLFPNFHPGHDGAFAMARLLEQLALSGRPLDRLLAELPPADVGHIAVPCQREAMGKVMRILIEATGGQDVELMDGVKVRYGDGWIAMIPDPVRAVFRIYAEPAAACNELVEEYRRMIEAAVPPCPDQDNTAALEDGD